MQATSGDTLEFESLRELLSRYTSSPLGQAQLAAMAPHSDRGALTAQLEEIREGIEYLRSAGKPQPAARGSAIRIGFEGIPELRPAVQKLRIEGAALDPKEIADLFAFLDRSADAKSILNAVSERFPRLGLRGLAIGDFRQLLHDLEGKLNPDGTVADHASVALNKLRRDIERLKKSIQDSLERFLRANRDEGVLQEEFVTIRNDRFVVPIIPGQRRKIPGVVHGTSASGHTLFLEPLETIELNNELVRLNEEELREVHRILLEMTERMRGHSDSIQATLDTMGELEFLFAKARFAIDFDCSIPRFSPEAEPRLVLRDARHPLLEDVLRRQRRRVVPFSVDLNRDCRTLLISGPNAGGKTVTMKTVGLLALMAHSGLPVPAAEADFPLFSQVLADIGDKQSIEQNLSTFSAHMSHIREMALDVTPDSLVLLDELGSATDPEEGGALGVAIVEHFRAAGAFTLVSTHLVALKIYGANTDCVVNGSMGFDEETLQPTYELRTGAPGKSAGLEIAQRLGMPESIMLRARASLTDRDRDMSRFLSELQARLGDVRRIEEQLRSQQAALAAKEKELAREWEKRESAKLRELERRCEAVLQRFDSEARETIEKVLESAQQRKAADLAQRRVAKVKRELRESFETTVLSTEEDARRGEVGRPKIVEGSRVRLKDLREPARVRRRIGEDRIEVEAGFMKMQVSIDDVLEVLPDVAPAASKLPKGVSYKPAPQLAPAHQELNVIGQHVEEALSAVDEFLDRAVMATASRVRIVHGHGMGVLRKAISEMLGSHPHVARHYPAPQQEGGAGATIVEIRE